LLVSVGTNLEYVAVHCTELIKMFIWVLLLQHGIGKVSRLGVKQGFSNSIFCELQEASSEIHLYHALAAASQLRVSRGLHLIKDYHAWLLAHRFLPPNLSIFFSYFRVCLCAHQGDPLNRIESNNVFSYC